MDTTEWFQNETTLQQARNAKGEKAGMKRESQRRKQ